MGKYIEKMEQQGLIKIKLRGFRSHANRDITIKKGDVTHICGVNGSGKSDIYYSIMWCLYAPNTSRPHNIYNQCDKVRVEMVLDDIKIKRTSLPNTFNVVYKGKTHYDDDAQYIVNTMFGSYKQWCSMSFFEHYENPFVSARWMERLNILNEIVDNNEIVRKKAAILYSDCKTRLKDIEKDNTKVNIKYSTKYGDTKPNTKLIIDDDEVDALEKELLTLQHNEKKAKEDITRMLIAKKEKNDVDAVIDKYGHYNKDEYESLVKEKNIYSEYSRLLPSLQRVIRDMKKYNKECSDVPKVGEEELQMIYMNNKLYNSNKTICDKENIKYNPTSVSEKISHINECLKFNDNLSLTIKYDKLVKDITAARKSLGDINKMSPLEYAEFLERNISYSDLLSIKTEMDKVMDELKSVPPMEELEDTLNKLNVCLSNQWIISNNKKYNTILSKISLNGSISDHLIANKALVSNIEKSKTALYCPHCNGTVKYLCGKILKFDGVVVDGDVKKLTSEIRILEELSEMRLIEYPDGLVEMDEFVCKAKIKAIKDSISKRNHLSSLVKMMGDKVVPDDIVYVDVKSSKKKIDIIRSLIKMEDELKGMTRPEIPDDIEYIESCKANTIIKTLNAVTFIDKPSMTYEEAKLYNEYHKINDSIPHGCKKVIDSDIVEYSTKMKLLEDAKRRRPLIINEIKSIDECTDLEDIEKRIKNIKNKLKNSDKHKLMNKEYQEKKKINKEYDLVYDEMNSHKEYKDILKRSCILCIEETLSRIQEVVNSFLMKIDMKFSVKLENNNEKIKIHCIDEEGVDYGEVRELSKGQRSCISFGFNIAFTLLSNCDIIILDEVTDKMSIDNRDKCIEILIETMRLNNKTLIITDNNCHTGDYDKVITIEKQTFA